MPARRVRVLPGPGRPGVIPRGRRGRAVNPRAAQFRRITWRIHESCPWIAASIHDMVEKALSSIVNRSPNEQVTLNRRHRCDSSDH